MSTYTSIKCPHCKYPIYHGSRREPQYGSPIKHCPSLGCRKPYVDDNYREIAIDGLWTRDKFPFYLLRFAIFILIDFLFIIGGLVFLFVPAGFFNVIGCIGALALGITHMKHLIADISSFRDRIETETRESEARLKNPDYALALRYYGYAVPDKYISPEDLAALRSKGL